MAIFYDFQIMMAAKLSRLLNKCIQPTELTFGAPSAPSELIERNTVVDVTYDGVTRQIAYDRASMTKLLIGQDASKLTMTVASVDPADILARFNKNFSTTFVMADFITVEKNVETSTVDYTFDPMNKAFVGTFSVGYFIPGSLDIPFSYFWPLTTDLSDIGTVGKPMVGDWTMMAPIGDGTMWGRLNNGIEPMAFPDALTLPLTGDFLYDFEIVITASMAYVCTLSTNLNGTGSGDTIGSLYFAGNKPYLYMLTAAASAPAFALNTPMRFTILGLDGKLSLYHKGMLIETVNQPPAGTKFVGFRNREGGTSQLGQNSYIRNFKALVRRPTAEEVFKTLNGEVYSPTFPAPLHHIASIAGDYTNRGTAGGMMNAAFPTGKYLNKPWFGGPSGGSTSLGVTLAFSGDFTVDFEVAASSVGDSYGMLFTAGVNTNIGSGAANGDLFTWRNIAGKMNAPCLYNMGYGSAGDDPLTPLSNTTSVRLTITRKAGVIKWYQNGVLKWTFTNTTVFNWRYFSCNRTVAYFRNLRFWNLSLTPEQLSNLFTF